MSSKSKSEKTNKLKWKKAICGICPAGCWVRVGMNNGRMEAIEADTGHPLGMICRRGEHTPEIVYSEHRIKYPLKRKNKKGNYEFERISWDDAYDDIVKNLNKIKEESGPEAVSIYTGRGAEIIVIDPRCTDTVGRTGADWIPIRPGTDGALALGILYVMIYEELYDEHFVENWCHGFNELETYVQHFRPEIVENITGVPTEKIISLAMKLSRAKGACPVMYTGLEYSNSGIQAIRAVLSVFALAGQLDVPGGIGLAMLNLHFPINRSCNQPNRNLNKAVARDKFPVYSQYRGESHASGLVNSVLHGNPYRIRGLIIHGASLITSWPQSAKWHETLSKLDFLVTIDRQLTSDSAYADIVLPATTMFEIDSYMTYGPVFRLREKVIEPVGEARNDYLIMSELAEKLGYGHLYPQSEEEVIRFALSGSGFSLEDIRKSGGWVKIPTPMMEYKKWEKGKLRPDGKPGFDTPTGKFEIWSAILEDQGYEPLPKYTEPLEGPIGSPTLFKEFPLVFNSGARPHTDFRSQHHGISGLAKDNPEPKVEINIEDARKRGIKSRDLVEVRTIRGSVKFRAHVTKISDGTGSTIKDAAHSDRKEVWFKQQKKAHRRIYLDNNATSDIAREVYAAMKPYLEIKFGNPSAIHTSGRIAHDAMDNARRQVARLLNTHPRRIIFAGGGSEANNLALKGVAFAHRARGNHIITSAIEHPAILQTCHFLARNGFDISYLDVDQDGMIQPETLKKVITDQTILVSIMLANNEVGTIQPVKQLCRIAHDKNLFFHTDAVQAAGKIEIDVEDLDIDLLTVSGHKFHGPKGTGVLYVKKGVMLEPLIHGGKQETGLRAGTENIAGIVGMGRAAELALTHLGSPSIAISKLRDELMNGIKKLIPEAVLNGHPESRLPNTLNMTLPGLRGESLVIAMDQHGIALSSGSACKSGSPDPTHVLLAMGRS